MPAGWCLGLVQRVYGAPGLYNTAWQAWEATKDKHYDRDLPPVSVPVWFDHWGTYDGVYGRFGHVVAWIPGRGFLSSPANGVGQDWVATIEQVERRYSSKYVGWTTDINTVKVAEYIQEVDEDMAVGAFFRIADGANKGGIFWQEKPNMPFVPINEVETWNAYAANGNKFQDISGAMMDALKKKYGVQPVPSDGGTVNVNVPDFKITMSGEAVKK
jgi:hypothetical protein